MGTVVAARITLGSGAAVTEIARLVAPAETISLLADGSSGKLTVAIGAYVDFDDEKPEKATSALRTDVRILNVTP